VHDDVITVDSGGGEQMVVRILMAELNNHDKYKE